MPDITRKSDWPALLNIENSDWASLLDGLAQGEYHLLLGAGASLGALDRHKRPLPNGTDLARQLIADFQIDARGQDLPLARAYELAKRRTRSGTGTTLNNYFTDRFTECQPPDWYKNVCSLRWQQIWTFNVDDVVEQAYASWKKKDPAGVAQEAVPLSWTDRFRHVDTAHSEVFVLHLHGVAERDPKSEVPPDFVFDIVEYLRAGKREGTWPRAFEDMYETQPFIVVGARLLEEYDLADVLRRGNRSKQVTGRPSFLVSPHITGFLPEELPEWGLIPVTSDAESFFWGISEDLPPVQHAFNRRTYPGGGPVPREARAFNQQFRQLQLTDDSANHRSFRQGDRLHVHDFHAGDDPVWQDIVIGQDAPITLTERLLGMMLNRASSGPVQSVYCITGGPFSGKTTTLFATARRLLIDGWEVYLFEGESKLDIDAARWWLDAYPRTVLLFDGLADPAPEIGDLVDACNDSGTQLIIVGTERNRRKPRLLSSIPASALILTSQDGKPLQIEPLSDRDIDSLLERRRSLRRLGMITNLPEDLQRRHFVTTGHRRLFDALQPLEGGKGFEIRVEEEFNLINDEVQRDVYVVCCLAYDLGYALPIPIVAQASGIETVELIDLLAGDGPLSDLLRIDPHGRNSRNLKPRNRKLATVFIDEVMIGKHRDRLYSCSLALAHALSDYVNLETVRQRTLPYWILRELMDQVQVRRYAGKDRVREWYEQIQEDYQWNARYWEQRALAEAGLGDFARAESYAETAISTRRDSFTLNTLGTILMKKAVTWPRPGSEEAWQYYWRAVSYLQASLDSAPTSVGREIAHPYTAFFGYTIRFAQDDAIGAAPDEQWNRMVRTWNHWYGAAKNSRIFTHPDNWTALQRFRNEWLLLAAREASTRGHTLDEEADE